MKEDTKLKSVLRMFHLGLQIPLIYSTFKAIVTGGRDRWLVAEYVKPRPTDRILDLGCGPADIVDKLNECQYVGVDHDPGYIARARKKHNGRAQFHVASIADIDVIEPLSFDIVLSIGVLHHLTDGEAMHLFQVAHKSLKPTGRLITVDGCLTEPQKKLCRFFLGLDRGQYVRDKNAYVALASSVFPDVKGAILEDLIRIPYTHLIMLCSKIDPKLVVEEASSPCNP